MASLHCAIRRLSLLYLLERRHYESGILEDGIFGLIGSKELKEHSHIFCIKALYLCQVFSQRSYRLPREAFLCQILQDSFSNLDIHIKGHILIKAMTTSVLWFSFIKETSAQFQISLYL